MSRTKFFSNCGVESQHHIFSPGRVNLIGEHIDYCGGLVMPMAINRGTHGWLARSDVDSLEIYSGRFNETVSLALEPSEAKGHWSDFAIGVISLLSQEHSLRGTKLCVSDDIGAGGLSSSASFSLLLAHSLLWAAGVKVETDAVRFQLAKLSQRVEHEFVGVQCGIMDQASIALGGILSLDCGNLHYDRIGSLPDDYQIVVMDTRHPRDLAGSKYNERVLELAAIREQINPILSGQELCDLRSTQLLETFAHIPDNTLQRRLRHVVTENERVLAAKDALDNVDIRAFGELMNASHDSLHSDYEVAGNALNEIVMASRSHPSSIGSRMTGAGFGGCALALVASTEVEAHNAHVVEIFESATGVKPQLFAVNAGPAAG